MARSSSRMPAAALESAAIREAGLRRWTQIFPISGEPWDYATGPSNRLGSISANLRMSDASGIGRESFYLVLTGAVRLLFPPAPTLPALRTTHDSSDRPPDGR